MIIANKARCDVCGDVIESKHRHDFVTCSCGNLSVDGGKDYVRRCYERADKYTELSEYAENEEPPKEVSLSLSGSVLG